MSPSPEKEALRRAARVLGGQAALARAVGFKDRRGIWPYFKTERPFPSEHCPTVERLTREKGEAVLCEELRPDVDWPYVREQGPQVLQSATVSGQAAEQQHVA